VRFSVEDATSDSVLRVEICDDGAGLPDLYRPGIGLNSMKERADEVGGNCVVESLKQGGTRVLASLPLSQ
jgi:signal transduction histidine kinase